MTWRSGHYYSRLQVFLQVRGGRKIVKEYHGMTCRLVLFSSTSQVFFQVYFRVTKTGGEHGSTGIICHDPSTLFSRSRYGLIPGHETSEKRRLF